MHVCLALSCLAFMKCDIELGMASDTLGSSPAEGPWKSHIASFHFYSASKYSLNHRMAMRIKWKNDVKVFNSVPITGNFSINLAISKKCFK